MDWLLSALLGTLLLPPLNLTLLALAGWLLQRLYPKAGKLMITTSLLLLLLLSLPLVGNTLLRTLQTYPALTPGHIPAADAIVVLGGGAHFGADEYGGDTLKYFTLERIRYAARLQRATHLPLLTTGGRPEKGSAEAQLMAEALQQDFNVPTTWQEGNSNTTAQNATLSARILLPAGKRRILLVTHAWHMARAVPTFRKAGFEVIPAPTMGLSNKPHNVFDLIPSVAGLLRSYYAMHEWLGLAWYKLGGKA
ncbi:MAG: hypothetical protein RL210_1880 [Pseudomonadota bacterium]|jgi:uncharacterized SAM-binding protein YcdF (DUF218 family)|nr:hypothetical protein [Pseudomonadota bacterium]